MNEITNGTIIHKATSMTTLLCGTPINIAGHGWANGVNGVTCKDCKIIMEIQKKNREMNR